jgi:hypothetical protein
VKLSGFCRFRLNFGGGFDVLPLNFRSDKWIFFFDGVQVLFSIDISAQNLKSNIHKSVMIQF